MNLKSLVAKIKEELEEIPKVFLYEPDNFIAELLIEALKNYDIHVKYYPSKNNLINELLKENYQIFIFYIEPGDKKSEEIIRESKKLKRDLLIYGIVEITKDIDISQIFAFGVDEVIFKPFSIGEFRARLLRLLREYYLLKKIERFIIEDPLTGIYNRRYFEISIREEVYRAIRQNYPLSLLIVDLDNFKWFNDTFGHKAGDALLRALGEVLQRSTRLKVDKPCRYGGDEFGIILPFIDWKGATKVVERIFRNWNELNYGPVTLSVGIAQMIDRGDLETTITDLIQRADQAMYRAKKREGNSYEVDRESLRLTLNEVSQEGGLLYQALPLLPVPGENSP